MIEIFNLFVTIFVFHCYIGYDYLPRFVTTRHAKDIMKIDIDCLTYGIQFDDTTNPFLSLSPIDLAKRLAIQQRRIERQKKLTGPVAFNTSRYMNASTDNQRRKMNAIFEFEHKIMSLGNMECFHCSGLYVDFKSNRRKYICHSCKNNHQTIKTLISSPHWIDDDNNIRYDIPEELQNLRVSEQLLIQKASPYIPVVHIRNGTLGIHGHCISFPQDISSVCESLPRMNCKLVRFIRHYGSKSTGATSKFDAFIIRRSKVMNALVWLKKYNPLYRDDPSLVINEQNLSWMKGCDEAEMQGMIDYDDEMENDTSKALEKVSVSSIQTDFLGEDNLNYSGACVHKPVLQHGKSEQKIVQKLETEVSRKRKNIQSMDFPQLKEIAINEYDGVSLFASSFPWLFPGGVGDIYNKETGEHKDVQDWLEKLMRYKDGRFQNDKTFAFYANDFVQRKLANSNGGFFVKQVCGQCPQTLHDLQREIRADNYSFVNKLQYFSGSLKGTDSYWRRKREELNAWITYHLEQKHGPPTLFITLSCAEYWWPDLQILLSERLRKSGNKHHDELAIKIMQGDHSSRIKGVNLHTGLVQDFFHKKTEAWLQIVGKKVFKIEYYWAAYEFAAGRGQIHTHLLAITKDQHSRLKQYFMLRHDDNCYEKRVSLMSSYARNELDMTANHPGLPKFVHPTNMDTNNGEKYSLSRDECVHALSERFIEANNDIIDQRDLSHCCQRHECNKFCMRHKRNTSR